jgi:hypothetical protein
MMYKPVPSAGRDVEGVFCALYISAPLAPCGDAAMWRCCHVEICSTQ